MRKQEIIYIAVDNKDADWFLGELCKPGIITDTCLRVDRKKKMLETQDSHILVTSAVSQRIHVCNLFILEIV